MAEFDPSVWLQDHPEEEEDAADARPCPVCGECDNEDVLLLCDRCDAPYHTFCIGLERVPRGNWFCMECESDGAYVDAAAIEEPVTRRSHQREYPRTQGEQRRSRRRTRPDLWLGAWSRFSRTVHDVTGLDLDFSEDDSVMDSYRHHQHLLSVEARNRESGDQWRQRSRIAERQGVRESFGRIAAWQRTRQVTPPSIAPSPTVESAEQTQAWQAFDRAREVQSPAAQTLKRKARSLSATPEASQAPKEPERKLKRPRTRRLENVGASSASVRSLARPTLSIDPQNNTQDTTRDNVPSFLSNLLREVETAELPEGSPPQPVAVKSRPASPPMDYTSPGSSPSPTSSVHRSPRAMSTTPPPVRGKRSHSPVPLSSRVEPRFARANHAANVDGSPTVPHTNGTELRHPRPRRQPVSRLPRSTSPARLTMSSEVKESVNRFVKAALAPHWKTAAITKDQYANINRDVSRMLYGYISEQSLTDQSERSQLERVAVDQVDSAIKALC